MRSTNVFKHSAVDFWYRTNFQMSSNSTCKLTTYLSAHSSQILNDWIVTCDWTNDLCTATKCFRSHFTKLSKLVLQFSHTFWVANSVPVMCKVCPLLTYGKNTFRTYARLKTSKLKGLNIINSIRITLNSLQCACVIALRALGHCSNVCS